MADSPPGKGPHTSGPKIIRPIPRRPFNLGLSSPTPPEDDDEYSSPRPQISASDLRFLAPHQHAAATPNTGSRDGSTPLSHTTSYLNLTSPTLFGIYSPSTLDSFLSKDEDDQDQRFGDADARADVLAEVARAEGGGTDAPSEIPWLQHHGDYDGGGDADEDAYYQASTTTKTARDLSRPMRRRDMALQVALRAALLFGLGVGYGVLVTRLPHARRPHGLRITAYETHCDWRYLAFWGAAGVALGSLLPWFDRFWEDRMAAAAELPAGRGAAAAAAATGPISKPVSSTASRAADDMETDAPVIEKPSVSLAPRADWALVVRGIGAFVGIVFAIRKLPWASTMQVSLTLALVNPFLWYLIDRSKPGFLLSAAVGLAGSAVLMGINPAVMPAPTAGGLAPASAAESGPGGNVTGAAAAAARYAPNATGTHALGGLASQETIETTIWMLSVLFCSCVCFGNIGRRLALNSSAAGRGRWGGVR